MPSSSPISAAKLNANRANSLHSTGPRTKQAKCRTRLNGLRHGLTGKTIVMPTDDYQAYQIFIAKIVDGLQPATTPEHDLAQAIANESWRLDRARTIEENIFSLDLTTDALCTKPPLSDDPDVHQALTQARTFLDNAREIELLSLYAGRIARTIDRSRAELKTLQSQRALALQTALEEALLLIQLARSKGQTYKPSAEFPELGFAFSTSDLIRIIDRRARLAEAVRLFSSSKTSKKAA